ncbi:MAG: alkaline phosphatase D family protein, partial [Moraxellaceae bacterium]
MKRRDFLKMGSFMTVSVAAIGVTGCSLSVDGDDDANQTGTVNRPMPSAATGANWWFPQSVASGDPRPDSVVFWTRVVPSTGATATDPTAVTTTSTAIRLLVSSSDESAKLGTNTALNGTIVADVTVPAYADFDGTVRHKLTELTPNTTYFFQFVAGDARSKVGRVKTAQAESASNNVKFAFMSCQDWSDNHWGAFSQIVTDDGAGSTPSLDFVVHLGDYIYETDSATTAEALHTPVSLPSGGEFAATRDDYRYLYKLYRSDTRIQAFHERFPM